MYYDFHAPRQHTRAVYTHTTTPACTKVFISEDAFRVLLRSVGSNCRDGRLICEDGVLLYGWRIKEKNGELTAIVTDIVESSPHATRSAVTFDVDHDYAIHRDKYLRDRRGQNNNYNLLGFIHSHPSKMTWFSATDIATMGEYTRSDMQVLLSGLVTLHQGALELTMYTATQEEASHMSLWDLPVVISNAEVERRMPAFVPKSFEEVWREASRSDFVPHFKMLEEYVAPKDKAQSEAAHAAETKEVCKNTPLLDISSIPDEEEGLLCGRMSHGVLHLYLRPTVAERMPQPEEVTMTGDPPAAVPPDDEPAATKEV